MMNKILYLLVFLFLFISHSVFAEDDIPKFKDYLVNDQYTGKNRPLVMDSFGKMFKTRLNDAIENSKPTFAGRYIVTGWGCGTSGCNTGAIIDAITGKSYSFPVAITSVYPLKPEFEDESGQEHIYRIDSRLMIFAGGLETENSNGDDIIEFYEFKNDKFHFIKSMPYGKKDKTQ